MNPDVTELFFVLLFVPILAAVMFSFVDEVARVTMTRVATVRATREFRRRGAR